MNTKKLLSTFLVVSLLGIGACISRAQAPQDNWTPLRFLLGDWVGEGSGAESEGSGGCSFQLDLKDNVIVRKNWARYPATHDRPALAHDDLMIIYRDSIDSPLKAIFFDTEGHTIRYDLHLSADQQSVEFLSEPKQGTPRYRLTYWNVGKNDVNLKFEIAPPDKPDAFAPFIAAKLRRK